MSPPVLAVRGLAHVYPDGHQALFGVDLHVHRGERVALLGPNGAGKTTLVMHLNGILTPSAGSVSVSGLPVAQPHLPEVRRRVGIVFQDPDDQLFMPSVRDDVAFGPRNHGVRGGELDRTVMAALDKVGMAEFADRPPHHLSFGQRRRVAVATVLAMEPEILVLDEPSSNLDPASRRELADILRALDVTVLMVTHDLPYALELCPRSVILSGGVVVTDGPTREVMTDEATMSAHRLELPYGFDPRTAPPPGLGNVPSWRRGRPSDVPRTSYLVDEELNVAQALRNDSIERDIEETRDRLASTIDQLVYRTSPKTIIRREVETVKATFVDAQGNPRTDNILKAVGGIVGIVAVLAVIRRVTR